MKLIPISEHPDAARILYDLLEEREAHVNISHKKMPTWGEHLQFLEDHHPGGEFGYEAWYVILGEGGNAVGATYLTKAGEIGVGILRKFQGLFLGPRAVQQLMKLHPRKQFLANINPANEASRKMFEKLGFKTIQHTLALEAE